MYEYADRQIREINRRILHTFDRLRTLRFDELNVFKQVTAVYEESIRFCKKRYKWIAEDAYIAAWLVLSDKGFFAEKQSKKQAEERAEKRITDKWLDNMLNEPDPVTGYRFDTEAERKKDRLVETILAKGTIDKAIKLWALQTTHYADKSVDTATMAAYMDAGVEKVEWVTMDDIKVCAECEARDGKIYPIDEVPPKPHIRCRCELHPVI